MSSRSRGRSAASRRFSTSRLGLEALEAREVPATVGGNDPSFDANGVLATDLGGVDTAAAVAVQSDGKIVVAGTANSGGIDEFAVLRYNPDGSLDLTFDSDGRQTFGFTLFLDEVATSLVIQDDGKIVVGGYGMRLANNQDFLVARLNPDGSLDTSFDGDGKAQFDFAGGGSKDDRAYAVTTQFVGGQRKIVLAGTTDQGGVEDFNFGVLRLNDDGTVYDSFQRTLGSSTEAARAVAIDTSNRIVLAGETSSNFGLAVFTETGAIDNSFDTDGKLTTDMGGTETVAGLVIQPDGKIVVAGSTSAGVDFAVARYNPDGSLDNSFDGDGKVTPTLGGNDVAGGVALQPDGKIVIVGRTDSGGDDDFGVARLNPDGSFDTSFDGNGKRGIGLGGADFATGVAIDANGRIVIAGNTSANDNIALARLIGTVEGGGHLAVSGLPNGAAQLYTPQPGGTYGLAPAAAVVPFPGFNGAVRTAVADVNGDGVQDTIVATGPGGPVRFAVVSGADNATLLVNPTDPFNDPNFTGGLFVAAGDFDNDGRAEIVLSPDQGGGPRVTMFSLLPAGLTQRANFFGIDDVNFRGGARVAVGDINGDGVKDLGVAAGFLGGPRIALFDGKTAFGTPARLVGDFFGFPGADAVSLRNGAYLSLGDVDGDGSADLVLGGGPGGAPRVFVLSGAQLAAGNVDAAQGAPIANYFVANNAADRGGARVSAKDADGDNKADIAVGSGDGVVSRVRVYFGDGVTAVGEPGDFQDLDPFASAVLASGVFVG